MKNLKSYLLLFTILSLFIIIGNKLFYNSNNYEFTFSEDNSIHNSIYNSINNGEENRYYSSTFDISSNAKLINILKSQPYNVNIDYRNYKTNYSTSTKVFFKNILSKKSVCFSNRHLSNYLRELESKVIILNNNFSIFTLCKIII